MEFKIVKKSKKSRARLGIISTKHGVIHTPAFIPVGTQAAIKGLTTDQLKDIGADSLLCNTYHLYLRPGDAVVKKMGGLHKFMNWDRPIWTDSGGFQVFSLGAAIEHGVSKIANIFPAEGEPEHVQNVKRGNKFTKISEDGVEFKSHLDGSKHFLTPEKSIKIQENLGADLIFAFDECTSPLHDYRYTENSMERTHRWAKRCLKVFSSGGGSASGGKEKNQALFGIVQGGAYKDLRLKSAKVIGKMGFDGFGIGGSLGNSKKDMYRVLDWTMPLLPEKKPKHLLGIGSEDDILEAVKKGVDTFDCVAPTRLARNGAALLRGGKRLSLRSGPLVGSKEPIDKDCMCYTCKNYTRGYLNHLFRANEMLGPILATAHNLAFMEQLMKEVREKIALGKL